MNECMGMVVCVCVCVCVCACICEEGVGGNTIGHVCCSIPSHQLPTQCIPMWTQEAEQILEVFTTRLRMVHPG